MHLFSLNRNKQVLGLAEDAVLPDFDIVTNDNDKNVIIECSTAFYDAVAKPVLSGLSVGTTLNIANISINCDHIDYNKDRSGVEYNRVLHIKLGGGGGQLALGKVTIHLHHTTRNVQMQGSAIMPGGTRAPLWFLNNFVKSRFTSLARTKQYDIKKLNDAIKKAVEESNTIDNLDSHCNLCLRQFSPKSRPTQCSICHQYFHKTNCLPSHSSSCKSLLRRTKSTSSALQPTSSSLLNASIATSIPAKKPRTEVSTVVSPPVLLASSSSTAALSTQRNSEVYQLALNQDQDQASPQPPEQPPEHPPASSSQASTNVIPALTSAPCPASPSPPAPSLNPSAAPFTFTAISQPQITQKRKTKQKNPPNNPEVSKIEYLNLELNAAKTKIVVLETTVTDREATIQIQKERIKILEENLTSLATSKHLPSFNSSASTHSSSHGQCSPCRPVCCYPLPLCQQSHHHAHHPRADCEVPPSSVNQQSEILHEIKNTLNVIKEGIVTFRADFESNTDRKKSRPSDQAIRTSDVHKAATDVEYIDTVDVQIVNVIDNDESIASLDEFVPDSLNSNSLTNQQKLLMQ